MDMTNSSVAAQKRPFPFVPRIRLFVESVYVDRSAGLCDHTREEDAAVLSLEFDYPAGASRDSAAEMQARYMLEAFGPVELECMEDFAIAPGSTAEYMVHIETDVHQLCAFGAYAVPQLRAMGWHVDIDPDYRWHVVSSDTPWFASVASAEQDSDWFSLELGVDIDGRRVNLLPALLDMMDGASSLRSLVRATRRCVAVPVDDNHYLPLEPKRLKTVFGVLLELYGEETPAGRMQFARSRAGLLCRLEDAFDEDLDWDGDKPVRGSDVAYALPTNPLEIADAPAPAELRATLRPYQHEGLSWLQHLRSHGANGILADDMGLGKTLQTIAHLVAEKASDRADRPSLVVAPTSLVGNWKRELRKFAPHLAVVVVHGPKRASQWDYVAYADVVISTYPLVVRDRECFEQFDYHFVILDEAQTIKNRRSQAHKACCALSARHRLCLSGTPVENDLGELWSLFQFLMPGMLGDPQRFRDTFQAPIERKGAEERLDMLRERVSPYILRRNKEDVAKDLPPKTELVRAVELTGEQRDLYESIRVAAHARVRRTIAKKGISSSTIAILDALMKLRQVCCDPRLVSMRTAAAVKQSAKYELLMDMLTTQLAKGRRILVFSQFTSMLSLIAEGLEPLGIRHLSLTGSTRDRQARVDAFESGRADVFLISLKAGGTGLNLTSADTVIHYDPWWNPAAQAQATDRAYRIGQTKPVFVYNLIIAGSVEEQMLALQRRKRHLAQSILAPRGGVRLDSTEVDSLFAPLPGD